MCPLYLVYGLKTLDKKGTNVYGKRDTKVKKQTNKKKKHKNDKKICNNCISAKENNENEDYNESNYPIFC
jgi:hypothetical protein